ncbi:uncharacterized protein LOC134697578 [Mytilus trossulus]|uniref:uncharacterized protein LOC134697578 n=1 Tax=Mytilus trossulus TaxID=6551 RepID=UPI003004E7B8
MNLNIFAIKLFISIILKIDYIECACTLPTVLDGNIWDSRRGTIVVSNSNSQFSSGWDVSVLAKSWTIFNCIESDSTHWLFQSTNSEEIYGPKYYGFYCVRYTKITDYSYYYYLDSNTEENAADTRISFIEESVANAGVTISSVCNPTSGPSAEEFHVLVKENHQADVKQWFPDALLGVYAYTVTDASSSVFCGSGSVWDACTNRTTISFNYTQCSTQMFGSTGGEFYATKYVTSGSTSYVIIINADSSTSKRFTCLAVSGSSVSSNTGSCVKGQSATTNTSDSSSVVISLSAYETCPFTTASAASSSSNVGIIAGVVVVLILLIAGAIGGFIFYHKYKKKPFPWQKSKVQNGSEENAEKPDGSSTERNNRRSIIFESTIAIDPSSPKVVVDIQTPKEKNNSLPPLDENKNQPLPSITRT